MIVWGGRDNSAYFNTGGRYDPATDTWTPTSLGANVPEARQRATGVWTGTEIIVWGGFSNDNGFLNTGGRYNPATDTWVATATGSGVPSARSRQTAVWTGTEMIVWGGFYNSGGFVYPNAGGRYNPATDSWVATSTGANVLDGRAEPTSV
jgi:N-acetylneuraminic acid mutarotase